MSPFGRGNRHPEWRGWVAAPTITVSDVSPALVSKDDKVTFTITADEALEDTPEAVNAEPYEDGWFFRLAPQDFNELDQLLSARDYDALCAEG